MLHYKLQAYCNICLCALGEEGVDCTMIQLSRRSEISLNRSDLVCLDHFKSNSKLCHPVIFCEFFVAVNTCKRVFSNIDMKLVEIDTFLFHPKSVTILQIEI